MHNSVHETYGVHEIGFVVHEIKFEKYTRYSCIADEEQKKVHRCLFLEYLAVNIIKKFYITQIFFLYFWVHRFS